MTRADRPGSRDAARADPPGSRAPARAGRPGSRDAARAARPVLLAVAHGSRDPAAQRCVGAITRRVSSLAADIEVRCAFLENARPAMGEAIARAIADSGPDAVTIVPLLLAGAGYHLGQDIRRAASRSGVRAAAPLGPDPALTRALADRLADAGVPAGTPVVLAGAGSRDPGAAADARRQASMLAEHLGAAAVAAFMSAGRPGVDEAVTDLARSAGRPVAVAS
jgi:sirohydrochlorin ferrochelatase